MIASPAGEQPSNRPFLISSSVADNMSERHRQRTDERKCRNLFVAAYLQLLLPELYKRCERISQRGKLNICCPRTGRIISRRQPRHGTANPETAYDGDDEDDEIIPRVNFSGWSAYKRFGHDIAIDKASLNRRWVELIENSGDPKPSILSLVNFCSDNPWTRIETGDLRIQVENHWSREEKSLFDPYGNDVQYD